MAAMMPKEPKTGLALLFGKPEHGGEGDDYEMGGDDLAQACDEFLMALGIHLDDDKKKAACEALKAFVQMVDEEPHKEGEHEEEPDLGAEEEEGE